jgi:DNA processing protein
MPTLSPFWSAAVRLTGRIDLSALVDEPALHTLTARRLAARGVGPRHARALTDGATPLEAGSLLRITDPAYPSALRRVPFAPPVLFFEGSLDVLQPPLVAIVGARRCTGDGRRMATLLSSGVAGAGGVVVSGLAQGIDSAAHAAAGGRTVAVLGQGLGMPLPGRRGRLRADIVRDGGLVLSELSPSRSASRITFPMRNRIIAGLSAVTVVVEARERSGARITARNALEAGRDVLAVPGHPLQETSEGCLTLLREGAGLAASVDDVLASAGLRPVRRAPAEDPLLRAIGPGASFDSLLSRTGLTAPALLRELAAHELTGRVQRLAGGRYALAAG